MISDPEELKEFQLKKRMEMEDMVRRTGRWNLPIWIKYAIFEEEQRDLPRARSVYERALQVNYRHLPFWLKYVEMEMRHRFVNHARNVFDRAVQLLPRVDQLWYKYIHMEEMLGNFGNARAVYERWMEWEPDVNGWQSFINFENRYGETDRARGVFERFVRCHPRGDIYIRYAKFEVKHGEPALARAVYERALAELGEDAQTEEMYQAFATFETMVKDFERARTIYRYGLDHLPKSRAASLYRAYMAFEKQYGDRQGVEEAVLSKKRVEYEDEVARSPLNYDAWFDYVRLEEQGGDAGRVRAVYERAVAQHPPVPEKRLWQRYIYLWVNYALYEELEAGDAGRARAVYRAALQVVPHRVFTFGKLWIMAAHFEVRQRDLAAARKTLGTAIGMCPKAKVFEAYIDMEIQLSNVERVRALYGKYLDWGPERVSAWCRYAELEADLGEAERARALYEIAVSQPELDRPEVLWKAYIGFEIGEGDRGAARALYERLLERTQHVKVWLSYARFEAEPMAVLQAEEGELGEAEAEAARGGGDGEEEPAEREARARAVYGRSYRALREGAPEAKEEAVMLLDAWLAFERSCRHGGEAERERAAAAVEAKRPRRVKKRRAVVLDDGSEAGQEEYWDYVFPEEQQQAPALKLLAAAQRWKRQKTGQEDGAQG